jgi:hypothetical protein
MFEGLLTPALLVYLAFTANLALIYAVKRPQILLFAALTSSLYGIYSYIEISATGGLISALSVANILYQASVSEARFEATKYKRLIVTLATAFIGTLFLLKSGSDILPLCAFLSLCAANSQKSPLRIKLLYMLTSILWGCYSLLHQDLFSATTNFLMIGAFLHKFYIDDDYKTLAAKLLPQAK